MVLTLTIEKGKDGKRRAKAKPIDLLPNVRTTGPCRHQGEVVRLAACKSCTNSGRTEVPIHACPKHGECCANCNLLMGPQPTKCLGCPDYEPQAIIAPAWPMNGSPAWQGVVTPKPWEYQVTAAIPHLNTPDELALVVELLQLQTVKPYIVIIDTGSTAEAFAEVEKLRSWSVEVHALRFNALRHSSDFPAIAMDLALTACQTPWMFCTHADVFPRRRDLIEGLLSKTERPARESLDPVAAMGYRMSPRKHPDWERMVSHTCTLLHMPTMYRIGAGWNLRRCCEVFGDKFGGYESYEHPKRGAKDSRQHLYDNWPDTELLLNYLLWEHGLTPENGAVKIIGTEENMQRTLDANIDHCRSLTVARHYSSDEYLATANGWATDAMEEGKLRAEIWRGIMQSPSEPSEPSEDSERR